MTLKFAKPEPRRRAKRRAQRAERVVVETVRAACVERDGYCRIARDNVVALGPCAGPSEWAHLEEKRRFKTRGMSSEDRHSVDWTVMMCERHHKLYDAHAFDVGTPVGASRPIQIFNVDSERING